MEDKKEIFLTQEGYKKLEDELAILKTVRIIEKITNVAVRYNMGVQHYIRTKCNEVRKMRIQFLFLP